MEGLEIVDHLCPVNGQASAPDSTPARRLSGQESALSLEDDRQEGVASCAIFWESASRGG